MPITTLLLSALMIPPIFAFNWNKSMDAQWAFGCTFPGPSIGYRIVPGENCSSECYNHAGPHQCTHFSYTDETRNCTFLHKLTVQLDDAISAEYKYDVCGVLWRTNMGRSTPQPKKEKVEELWLWLGPVLGSVATIIGAVLTLLWARHETLKRLPSPAHKTSDESPDNYSAFDTYDAPLPSRRVGL